MVWSKGKRTSSLAAVLERKIDRIPSSSKKFWVGSFDVIENLQGDDSLYSFGIELVVCHNFGTFRVIISLRFLVINNGVCVPFILTGYLHTVDVISLIWAFIFECVSCHLWLSVKDPCASNQPIYSASTYHSMCMTNWHLTAMFSSYFLEGS